MEYIKRLNEFELIKLAKTSSCENTLTALADSTFIKVRRSVARNSNANSFIANRLANDSASNVSYWATRHNNYQKQRVVQSNDPCVVCSIDELQYHNTCSSCSHARVG